MGFATHSTHVDASHVALVMKFHLTKTPGHFSPFTTLKLCEGEFHLLINGASIVSVVLSVGSHPVAVSHHFFSGVRTFLPASFDQAITHLT